MPILIDGHNLIAKLPGIHLDDPDDEAQLVERLRRYQARTGKPLTVFFDGGLPGGLSRDLSTRKVEVVFAPAGQPADALIVSRVRRNCKPQELTVVTSDREIMTAVEQRGARVVSAETFAAELSAAPAADRPDDVQLTEAQVKEWLALFGETERR